MAGFTGVNISLVSAGKLLIAQKSLKTSFYVSTKNVNYINELNFCNT